MTAPAVDPAAEVERLRKREQELLTEIRKLTAENTELAAAAKTSRNFRADLNAGHINLDLDSWGEPVTNTHTLPHGPYINAIEVALTEAKLEPEQADAFVEDSYDVPYLRGVITLTPETSGIPADRYAHGLILIWDWHTGRDEDFERGPSWQWAKLVDEHGQSAPPEPLPVPGFVAPAMLAATVATLAHTGKPTPMGSLWHDHLRQPVEAAIDAWGAES